MLGAAVADAATEHTGPRRLCLTTFTLDTRGWRSAGMCAAVDKLVLLRLLCARRQHCGLRANIIFVKM